MALNIKSITCDRCGSSDVSIVSDELAVCNSCGSHIAVRPDNIYVQVGGEESESQELFHAEMIPERSEKDFQRAVLIYLAANDAPADVFDGDFGKIGRVRHQIVSESINYKASYNARIGMDRQEPYIAYETKYESVPYVENGVTKYRSQPVEKQVTKYRTVTDWTPVSGVHAGESSAFAENLPGLELDKIAFSKSVAGAGNGWVKPIVSDDTVSPQARLDLDMDHRMKCWKDIYFKLRGDHRDLGDPSITDVEVKSVGILNASAYTLSIEYAGEDHVYTAFPIGAMAISGDPIKNEKGADSIRSESDAKCSEREKQVESDIWKGASFLSFLTIGLLVLSIILSATVSSYFPIIAAFAAAALAFVFCEIRIYSVRNRAKESAEEDIARIKAEAEKSITDHRSMLLNALNTKLGALGLEPASGEDL